MMYETTIENFRNNLEKMVEDHSIKAWNGRDRGFTKLITLEHGKKFTRVVIQEKRTDNGEINHRSVYCFVQIDNGDILKPAGWKAPAKHARGNIYKADQLSGCGPYGVAYLR